MDTTEKPHHEVLQPEDLEKIPESRFHLYQIPLVVGGGLVLLLLILGFVVKRTNPSVVNKLLGEKEVVVSQKTPNIILIITDDQRADTLRYMPNVQKLLVNRGTMFANAHASTPLCCPSRANILTGLYAHNTNVWTNTAPDGGYTAFKDEETLPVWLQRAGYRTGLVGKYLNEYTTKNIPPGWDSWFARTRNTYYGYDLNQNGKIVTYSFAPKDYSTNVYADFAVDFITGKAQSVDKEESKELRKEEKKDERKQQKQGGILGFSVPFAQAQEKETKQPYFLMVAVDAPHTDGGRSEPKETAVEKAQKDAESPAKRLKQQRDQSRLEDDDPDASTDSPDGLKTHIVKDYYAMPAESDRANCTDVSVTDSPAYAEANVSDKSGWIREIPVWNTQDTSRMNRFATSQVCSLRAVDRLVKKIVEAVGADIDNTVIIFASDNGYAWGEHRWSAKNCVYNACTHIPLVISYPKVTKVPHVATTFAELVDIPATILSLAQVDMPERMNGRSLESALRNPRARIRDDAFIELRNAKNKPKGIDYALRTYTHLYITLSTGEKELYDLIADPYELRNLLSSRASSASALPVLQELSARLQAQIDE